MHVCLLISLTAFGGWTWAKLWVCTAWAMMAFYEQRRGPSIGHHWTTPASGVAWLGLTLLVLVATPRSSGWFAGGAALMVFGGFLRTQAIATLGSAYTDGVTPVVARVERGIYSRLHHPGELGALMLAFGAALSVASTYAVTWVMATLLPLTLYRFCVEERCLQAMHTS